MERTVAFTGHRDLSPQARTQLPALLDVLLEEEIAAGAVHFRTGGALGFDTLAALRVLAARERHPHIRLHLMLPCPTQTNGWAPEDIALYQSIFRAADSYRYAAPFYYNGVLQARNRMLVEGCDLCVAYLCTSHGGGAAYTAALALQNGAALINLADRLTPSAP